MTQSLGPDGTFPLGDRINAMDRGGLYAGFTVLKKERAAAFQFGTALSWFAVVPPQAIEMARMIRARCTEAFGRLPYDKIKLPVKVEANKEKGVVELLLPTEMSVLVANPEFWFALSEVMETTAKSMYD